MTLDEFLDLLRQTPRDWYLTAGQREIRRNDGRHCCCPISSCHPRGPRHSTYYGVTSHLLGLDKLTVNGIVFAADNNKNANPSLRVRLLDACGLAP